MSALQEMIFQKRISTGFGNTRKQTNFEVFFKIIEQFIYQRNICYCDIKSTKFILKNELI